MTGFLSTPELPAIIIITEDSGGVVDKYLMAATSYNEKGTKVIIDGSCRSACVLALSVKNVCVIPKTEIKFHHAYVQLICPQ